METIEINIKSNAPKVTQETTSLRQQVKNLRKEVESCTVGTEQYAQALQKLANATHEYREQQEAVRYTAADLGAVIENVQNVATGLASGFSAVNAIMTLTGSNSEVLEKTMVKLQASIALVQGLKGLEGLGKDLKRVSASIKAFGNSIGVALGPISILIGALTAIGAGLSAIASSNANKKVDELTESYNASSAAVTKMAEELEFEVQLHEAAGQSASESAAERIKNVDAIIDSYNRLIEQEEEMKKKYSSTGLWGWLNGDNKARKKIDENIAAYNEKIKEQEANRVKLEKQRTLSITRETATRKQEAIKLAEDISKAAQKAGEDVKKQLDEVVKRYSETIKSINSINKTLDITNAKTIGDAVTSDIDAWMTVYGTDPKKMQKSLTGTLNALIRYAYDEASKIRDAALKKAKNESEKTEIANAFTESIEEIYDAAYPESLETGVKLANLIIEGFTDAITESKSISETFTEQFNALNHLYEEGIVDYKQFYDTLINIQSDYQTSVADFEAQYIDETKMSEEYIAQLRYQYALKPIAFQKEVGEKFLNELDKQFAEIERKTQDSNNNLTSASEQYWTEESERRSNWWKFWVLIDSQSLKERYNAQIQALDSQKAIYDEEYNAKVAHIQELLSLNTLTTEQEAQLNAQLAALNDEKLQNDLAYYENSTAARNEYYNNLQTAVNQGIGAMGDLSSNLADIFESAAETMKDSEGNYTKEGKKMLETSAALQIATATMNAASGIATVWATSAQLGPIAGPIVAGIQTAAHIANLAVQIMSIKRALAQGLAGNTSGSAEAQSVDTTFTLTSPDAYQNTLSDEVQTDLQANTKSNQRVYVLESDITSKQDNVKSAVTTSTF